MEVTDQADPKLPLYKKPLDTGAVSALRLTQDKYSEPKKPIYRSDAISIH